MNSIAFIFTRAPYGEANGREGVDALLAISSFCKKIGVFFIADGVFLLVANQEPKHIFVKDFISTLGLLKLYNINYIYLCKTSAKKRGIKNNLNLKFNIKLLSTQELRQKLLYFDIIISF